MCFLLNADKNIYFCTTIFYKTDYISEAGNTDRNLRTQWHCSHTAAKQIVSKEIKNVFKFLSCVIINYVIKTLVTSRTITEYKMLHIFDLQSMYRFKLILLIIEKVLIH